MGILDDAIKEHLELKRQHGADASELKQLEDEAFGAAERPGDESSSADPAAEAPTEFMQRPDLDADAGIGEASEAEAPEAEEQTGRRAELADLQEALPAPEPVEDAAESEPPAEEEEPAMEHETIAGLTGPSTEEREAIAEQPTEMYDIEEELGASQPDAPSEEELVEEEMDEPRLAPVDPLAGLDAEDDEDDGTAVLEDDEDDDFWDEKRLSDELDQALEAPSEVEGGETSAPAQADSAPAPAPPEEAPPEDAPAPEEPAPPSEDRPAEGREEDVLEETPDFLEEAPEADRLWFEQKPPKDFDFDD